MRCYGRATLVACLVWAGTSMAHADLFDITLTGTVLPPLSGIGSFSTDGICVQCGLLTFFVDFGLGPGDQFNIPGDFATLSFDRPTGELSGYIMNHESNDVLQFFGGSFGKTWDLLIQGEGDFRGLYLTTPVPEPSSIVLALTAVTLLGFLCRRTACKTKRGTAVANSDRIGQSI